MGFLKSFERAAIWIIQNPKPAAGLIVGYMLVMIAVNVIGNAVEAAF